MDFKEMKKQAIKLYKEGKTIEEIRKVCKMPIAEETVEKWMQENNGREKVRKIEYLFKKIKKLKNIKMTNENKEEIIEMLEEYVFEVLELDENNQIAMNELVRIYSIKKEYELGRQYGIKLLKENPNNIFALYNMSKLEMSAGNNQKALEYNTRLLEIEPENEQGIKQRNLILKNIENEKEKQLKEMQKRELEQYESEMQKQDEEILGLIAEEKMSINAKQRKFGMEMNGGNQDSEENESIDKKQRRFGMEQNEGNKYSKEKQKKYMEKLQKQFYEGKINSKNIEKIKEELYKYPDKVESVIFISELYYLITEKEDKAIDILDDFIDSADTLTPTMYHDLQERISYFRRGLRKQIEEYQQEEERKNKEIKIEQKKYMIEIANKLNERTIKKEEVESIVKKLEKCQDRLKVIFLIVKMYEIVYGRQEALKSIEKYSKIKNITKAERELIVRLRANQTKQTTNKSRKEKIKDRIKKTEKQNKFKKEIAKKKIIELLDEGKSVKEIYEMLGGKEFVSLKSIAKIRSSYIQKDEETIKKHSESVELATKFLEDGYSVEEVYELFEYNIGKNVLNELKQKMNQKEI